MSENHSAPWPENGNQGAGGQHAIASQHNSSEVSALIESLKAGNPNAISSAFENLSPADRGKWMAVAEKAMEYKPAFLPPAYLKSMAKAEALAELTGSSKSRRAIDRFVMPVHPDQREEYDALVREAANSIDVRVEATAIAELARLKGQDQARELRAAENADPLAFRPVSEYAAEVDAAGPPRWLFMNAVVEGDYGVLSAEDKAGKTWGMVDAAVSVRGRAPLAGSVRLPDPGHGHRLLRRGVEEEGRPPHPGRRRLQGTHPG